MSVGFHPVIGRQGDEPEDLVVEQRNDVVAPFRGAMEALPAHRRASARRPVVGSHEGDAAEAPRRMDVGALAQVPARAASASSRASCHSP